MNTPLPTDTSRDSWLEFSNGSRVPLPEICAIGRNPQSPIFIDSERVSRRHAVIRCVADGSFELMDLGSSNGTYLDGLRIQRPTALRDGQVIEIGLQKMTFRHAASAASGSPVATAVVDCWLLVVEAAMRGTREPMQHYADKTVESWNERCHRVILKHRGIPVRALKEGLLAYWRVDSGGLAPTLATALRSLSAVQKETEEFRFAVHFGPVTFKTGGHGESKPGGDAVIYTLQLQRLVTAVDTLVLISEAAFRPLSAALAMRKLTPVEMGERGGSHAFYTLA